MTKPQPRGSCAHPGPFNAPPCRPHDHYNHNDNALCGSQSVGSPVCDVLADRQGSLPKALGAISPDQGLDNLRTECNGKELPVSQSTL